jgi:sugar/nucleoside kinase (ribokinase family)
MKTAGQVSLDKLGRAAPADPSIWADREILTPCYQVKVVGTTGSGDATIAGFLSAVLRDLPPEQAVNAAVAVGACNVEAADALSGLLTWEDTLSRISRGWPKHPLTVEVPGWEWEEQHELWRRV